MILISAVTGSLQVALRCRWKGSYSADVHPHWRLAAFALVIPTSRPNLARGCLIFFLSILIRWLLWGLQKGPGLYFSR